MIYNIRKWRHNKKRTGFILEISCYDEDNDKWHNKLVNVPRADAYAGKNEDELPACLGAVMKDDCLWVKCRIFDNYVPKDDTKKKEEDEKNPQKGEKTPDLPF